MKCVTCVKSSQVRVSVGSHFITTVVYLIQEASNVLHRQPRAKKPKKPSLPLLFQALFGMHELFWLYFAKTSMTKKGSFFRSRRRSAEVHALVERLARDGNVHQRDRVG